MSNVSSTASPPWLDLNRWSRQLIALALLLAIFGIGLFVMGEKLPALAAIAAGCGIVLLVHPNTATIVTTFVLYTNAAAVATLVHGVPKAAAAGTFMLLLIPLYHQLVVQRKRIIINAVGGLLLLFAVIQLVTMLTAQRSDVAVAVLITTVSEGIVLYFLVINVIREKAMLKRVVWTMLCAGAFMGALTVAQQLTGNYDNTFGGFAQVPVDDFAPQPVVYNEPPRSGGPIGEENYYAQFLLILMPLALTFALVERRRLRQLAAAATAAIVALAVAFTASRAAVVVAGAMVVSMAWLRQIRLQHLLILVVLATGVAFASPKMRERMTTVVELANFAKGGSGVRQIDKSTQGRITEVLAAVYIFADYPLQGVGPGNFPSQFLKKADAMGFQVHAEERMAHCAVLEIAAETGIFGLLCIVALVGVSFRELAIARRVSTDVELRNLSTAFLVVMIVLVVSSLFLSFAFVRYYWFVMAVASVTARLARESAADMSPTALSNR